MFLRTNVSKSHNRHKISKTEMAQFKTIRMSIGLVINDTKSQDYKIKTNTDRSQNFTNDFTTTQFSRHYIYKKLSAKTQEL